MLSGDRWDHEGFHVLIAVFVEEMECWPTLIEPIAEEQEFYQITREYLALAFTSEIFLKIQGRFLIRCTVRSFITASCSPWHLYTTKRVSHGHHCFPFFPYSIGFNYSIYICSITLHFLFVSASNSTGAKKKKKDPPSNTHAA